MGHGKLAGIGAVLRWGYGGTRGVSSVLGTLLLSGWLQGCGKNLEAGDPVVQEPSPGPTATGSGPESPAPAPSTPFSGDGGVVPIDSGTGSDGGGAVDGGLDGSQPSNPTDGGLDASPDADTDAGQDGGGEDADAGSVVSDAEAVDANVPDASPPEEDASSPDSGGGNPTPEDGGPVPETDAALPDQDAGGPPPNLPDPAFRLDAPSSSSLTFGTTVNGRTAVFCPPGNASVRPTALEAAPPLSVSFSNSGGKPFKWRAALGTSRFSVSPDQGTLEGGKTQTISVVPAPIPWPASTFFNAYGDVLEITTEIPGDAPHRIYLQQTARGAVITSSAERTTVDMGTVYVGQSNTVSPAFGLRNTGTGPLSVVIQSQVQAPAGTSQGFPSYAIEGTTQPIAAVLPAESEKSFSATFAPGPKVPEDAVLSTDAILVNAGSEPLCAPLPEGIVLAGRGTGASASYSPSSLSFPNVPCGSTPEPKTITFSNQGNAPYEIKSLALGKSGPDAMFSAYIGTPGVGAGIVPPAVPGGGPGSLVVTLAPKTVPKAVPLPGSVVYEDTLSIVYATGAGSYTAVIPVVMNPYGAVLRPNFQGLPAGVVLPAPYASKSPLNLFWFGSAQQNLLEPGQPASIAISNLGNAPADVMLALADGELGPFTTSSLPRTVPPGGINDFSAWSRPLSPTHPISSSFASFGTFTVSGANCGPEAFRDVVLAGQVASPVQIRSNPSEALGVGFGPIDCGISQAVVDGSAQAITLESLSPYAYRWTAALAPSAKVNGVPAFVLSSSSGDIAAGGGAAGASKASFSIVPNAAALDPANLPTTFPDAFRTVVTVQFTALDPAAPTQDSLQIPVTLTPRGAVLQWSQHPSYNVFVPVGGSNVVRVRNTGNVTVPYTVTLGTTTSFSLDPLSTLYSVSGLVDGAGGRDMAEVPVLSVSSSRDTVSAKLTTDGSVPLCAPLPGDASISSY